ncbi:MAG: glycosyl hydrolase family 18 protein, partial [Bacteroidota bacterium]
MRSVLLVLWFSIAWCIEAVSQLPSPALVGYYHNWNSSSAPYIALDQVDSRYNVIDVAFALPAPGTDYDMRFVPDQGSVQSFTSQVQFVQGQNRRVLISIGGATAPISLNTHVERDSFVSSMFQILTTYGFDGIDIDLEGSSLSISGGSISNPVDSPVIYLIQAVGSLMNQYRQTFGRKMLLTMAPETAFVQGGQSAYGGIWGAYLPVIHALRDSLDLVHVQLYNSGSMYGIDGNIYVQGTADFIVSQCEAVIQGFNTSGGFFTGLPASKVAPGLPACSLASGSGYADTSVVLTAVRYLMGQGPKPGAYNLVLSSGSSALGGLMTWSINWDAVPTCGNAYAFADVFEDVFGTVTSSSADMAIQQRFVVWPNPTTDVLHIDPSMKQHPIQLMDPMGRIVLVKEEGSGSLD